MCSEGLRREIGFRDAPAFRQSLNSIFLSNFEKLKGNTSGGGGNFDSCVLKLLKIGLGG